LRIAVAASTTPSRRCADPAILELSGSKNCVFGTYERVSFVCCLLALTTLLDSVADRLRPLPASATGSEIILLVILALF
jgi:hypothetical protein